VEIPPVPHRPFLIARTGRPLDAFVRWVIERRPINWLFRMLELLPMTTATYDNYRFNVGEKTDDPDIRARQRMLLGWLLDALPEQREELMSVGEIHEARTALRDVLAARGLTLRAADEARVEACTDHEMLRRWRKQAVVAASAAEALR
jgi:hypothetical protein